MLSVTPFDESLLGEFQDATLGVSFLRRKSTRVVVLNFHCPSVGLRVTWNLVWPDQSRFRIVFLPPTPKVCRCVRKKLPHSGNLILLTKGVKVPEIAVGAGFASTRFSLVRISIRDLVAGGNP